MNTPQKEKLKAPTITGTGPVNGGPYCFELEPGGGFVAAG
jgi:hypothetical protein